MDDQQLPESQVPEQVAALQSQLAELLAAQRRSLQRQEKLLHEVLEHVEREQRTIAQLIHDQLYQRLITARVHMEAYCSKAGEKIDGPHVSCAAAFQHLDAAIADARDVIQRLESSWAERARLRDAMGT